MKPNITKRSTIYLVWVIPIIAIIVSGILLFNEYAKMGETVTIVFKDARGFTAGETPVKYKGILIGRIHDIEVDPEDLKVFLVNVKIKKSFSKYLTEGAKFWKVSPKLKPTEITGLSTLFTGTYVEFSPATTDPDKLAKLPKKRRFIGFDDEPKTNVTYFKLFGEDGSLIEGTPVLYKKFIVGNVTRRKLVDGKIEYTVGISNEFAHLVKVDSKFWKVSPLDIRASIPELTVKIHNTFNLFFGGIEFSSPENSPAVCNLNKNSKEYAVCNKKGFYLFPSRSDTEYSRDTITLVLKNAHKVQSSLKTVYYKGEVAGKVIDTSYDVDKDIRYLTVKMKTKYLKYLNYKSYFWIEHVSLEKITIPGIVRGTHIEFEFKNYKAEPKKQYTLYLNKPLENVFKFTLTGNEPVALNVGDAIYDGAKKIGEIYRSEFRKNKEIYFCYIKNSYRNFINDSSVFYKKSAIEVNLTPEGANFTVSPLKQFIKGGVEVITYKEGLKLTKKDFPLFKDKNSAEKFIYLNSGGKRITLITPDVEGIYKGIPVFYKGMRIGKVLDYRYDKEKSQFNLDCYIEKPYVGFITDNAVFYKASGIDVEAGIKGIKIKTSSLLSVLKGAIVLTTTSKEISKKIEKHSFPLYSSEEFEKMRYFPVKLLMEETYGIDKNSRVVYKGLTVGKVKALSLKKELVEATLFIVKDYKNLFTEDASLYLQKAEFRGGGMKNAETVLSGAYIELKKGKSEKFKPLYKLAGINPPESLFEEGLRIYVKTDDLKSLSVDSPLLYKGFKIGNIEKIEITEDGKITLTVFVNSEFSKLIKTKSRFSYVQPLEVDLGFVYAKMKMESMETILKSGLKVENPEKDSGKPVKDGFVFVLNYDD